MAKREHHQIIVDFIFGVILGWKNRFSLHCQAIFLRCFYEQCFRFGMFMYIYVSKNA